MKNAYARLRHLVFKLIVRILPFPEPETIKGRGSVTRIHELLVRNKIERVLVVTDEDIVRIGLIDKTLEALKKNRIAYTLYSSVQPNPTIQNIEDGLQIYNNSNCRGVIAFGGGSPIDCAKIIAARATNKKPVIKMKGLFKVWRKLPYLVAVPTTAGTGTEATIVAVITDPENREKFAITDLKLGPAACILDPELLLGLPPHLTAATGMDALTHAVEAYVGVIGTSQTDKWALEAVKLVFSNLENSYRNGEDIEAREAMLLASHYGGKAFTRAYIGYVHAVAHNLGGIYGIPHGLANAIVLPWILDLSKDVRAGKLAELAVNVGLGDDTENEIVLADLFINAIRKMNKTMEIPSHVKEIREEDITMLAERIEKEANPAYPVPKLLWKEDFKKLLHDLKGL